MSVTLDELLKLAGRLDDTAGFDTPRERFRRFLVEYVTDARVARALIEQSPKLLDEQHHRAVQDLVVLLGRSLGFETRFGTYQPVAAGLKYDGLWRSRGQAEIVLEIRTNQTPGADVHSLVRSLAAVAATALPDPETRPLGLCVLTPLYANRARLDDAIAAARSQFPIRTVSLRALLSMADMVADGRLNHDEVVRLVEAGSALDFVAGLLDRLAVPGPPRRSAPPAALSPPAPGRPVPPRDEEQTAFWLATVAGDHAVTPEQFVELVIGKRHIFGVSRDTADVARRGDWICFYISGRGGVGRAQVASIEINGGGLRDAHQYRQLLRLARTELHLSEPIVPDFETQLRLRAARGPSNASSQPFMRIAERDFQALTKNEGDQPRAERSAAAGADPLAVSAADSPSHE
jgi:hypothetical protein